MARQTYPDELAVRFLLGQLSEAERSALEERFFKDDAVFEDLEIAEEELIERYLDNRLDASDRTSFERRVATVPQLRERVVFAKMLAKRVDASNSAYLEASNPKPVEPSPVAGWRVWAASVFQRPAYTMALVAALLIVVLGGLAWWIRQSRLETGRLDAQRRVEEQQRATREREPKSGQPGKIATLVLFAGGSRSDAGGNNELVLEQDQQMVQLNLTLENTSYTNYVVHFRGLQTNKPFTEKVPHREGSNSITVELQAAQLPTDDYTIQVDGVTNEGTNEPVSNYTLRVRRK